MGRLNDRLSEIAAGAVDRIPEPARKVMHRATEALRESGLADRVPAPGERAPRFVRPTADGRSVALADLLERGPAIVSFFRGRW